MREANSHCYGLSKLCGQDAGWIGAYNCLGENPVEQELVVSLDGKSL